MHQIGIGVLGPVFRTYDPDGDRLVAVKAFQLDLTPERAETFVDALRGIVEVALSHPSIIAPIEAGLESGIPFLAQEYVAAESLGVAMRHYAPARPARALPFVTELAAAVDAAHERGVVHGGLHLRDVFVTPDEARVTGFGVASALEKVGLRVPVRRPYTAPEMIAGRRWGPAADRFAVATIAYELLTGKRAAGTGEQVIARLVDLDAGAAAVPAGLREVFTSALANDPALRPATAAGFVSGLRAAVGLGAAESTPAMKQSDTHAVAESVQIGSLLEEVAPLPTPTPASPLEAIGHDLHARGADAPDEPDERDDPVAGDATIVDARVLDPSARSKETPDADLEALDRKLETLASPPAQPLDPIGQARAASDAPEAGQSETDVASPATDSLPDGWADDDDTVASDSSEQAPGGQDDLAAAAAPKTTPPSWAGRDLVDDADQSAPPLPLEPSDPRDTPVSPAIVDELGLHASPSEITVADAIAANEAAAAAERNDRGGEDAPTDAGADTADTIAARVPAYQPVAPTPAPPSEATDPPAVRGADAPARAGGTLEYDDPPETDDDVVDVGMANHDASLVTDLDRFDFAAPVPASRVSTEDEALPPSRNSVRAMVPVAIAMAVGVLVAYVVSVGLGTSDEPAADDAAVETMLDGSASGAAEREWSEETVGGPGPRAEVDRASDTASPAAALPPAVEPAVAPPAPEPPAAEPAAPVAPRDAPAALPPSRSAPTPPPPVRGTGWLLVRTSPPGATVRVDGRERGQTPLSLRDVAYGTHRIVVSAVGYSPSEHEVTVSADATVAAVRVDLAPVARSAAATSTPNGSMFIDSRPAGGEVRVDDVVVGVTPLLVSGLAVGTYRVRIEREGYRSWATTIEIPSADRVRVTASLDPVRGR